MITKIVGILQEMDRFLVHLYQKIKYKSIYFIIVSLYFVKGEKDLYHWIR
jgi:hypothetical protein